ncbi:hypothetical protein [Niabella ginsengisoli]|uniref:GNAT family N-acetyltransferase n=1 Tax=Niabella ginsengisoli TaxID=522298 RepID=A0ABS9SHW3_9BACT|nr:hypothetical protein [Niabella ginsengisoli]MCH5597959.1 hypothetical protein [Niabella ginsengisoli]
MTWQSNEFYFTRLSARELIEMLTFYLKESYAHFCYTDYTQQSFQTELKYLLKEDEVFFESSIYYVVRHRVTNEIHGSIKTTYWDTKTILPIQVIFGIELDNIVLPDCGHFWHLGRFAISHKLASDRISIFKKMLFNAFYPVYSHGNGLIIAECDKKVTNTLMKMGINSVTIGDAIEYIHSETLPIYIQTECLHNFITTTARRYYSSHNADDCDRFSEIISLCNDCINAL